MGNEQASIARERHAANVEQLVSDIETANKIAKEKLPQNDFYLRFGIPNNVTYPQVKDKSVPIKIYKIKDERILEEWRTTTFKTFYSILTRMQLEATMYAHSLKVENEDDECTICMENKCEVSLSCSHAFCENCIQQWNLSSATCPICRRDVNSSNQDSWIIQDAPSPQDVAEVVYQYINQITGRKKSLLEQNFKDFL
jgi:hypothetical protein